MCPETIETVKKTTKNLTLKMCSKLGSPKTFLEKIGLKCYKFKIRKLLNKFGYFIYQLIYIWYISP